MTTLTLTADAQQLYDRYLQTVRWSVRGIADADEIERDVREHVATALMKEAGPVTSNTLREVLSRLGDPWQWIPLDELPLWRRTLMRFWLGPDDWRLAYVCFGLLMVGLVTLPIGIGVVFLLGAYLLARATCEVAADRDGSLGARRWLVYPPLLIAAVAVASFLLIAPVAPVLGWGIGERGFLMMFDHAGFNFADPVQNGAFIFATGAVTVGIWWIAFSALAAVLIRPLRFLVAPFADRLRRIHMLWMTAAGVVLLAGGVAGLMLH
jgi:hypothetical protein